MGSQQQDLMNFTRKLAALCFAFLGTLSLSAGDKSAKEPVVFLSEKYLKLLKEPSLGAKVDAAKLPAIRFTWVRTFHAPISLRAYMTAGGPRLRVARMSGKGGYGWGTLDFENEFPLAAQKWEQLKKLIAAEGAREPLNADLDCAGMDGSYWVLEVADAAGYTVEKLWSPLDDEKKPRDDMGIKRDAFVAVCKFLIAYAPMDPEGIY